jgi:hypothetical protein
MTTKKRKKKKKRVFQNYKRGDYFSFIYYLWGGKGNNKREDHDGDQGC